MHRDNRCMYMVHVWLYVCCSDFVGVCGNVSCVAVVVKDMIFILGVLKHVVCLCKGCDGCCVSVCIVMRGSVGASVWEVRVFRHAYVVCWCLMCILWQFPMLRSA